MGSARMKAAQPSASTSLSQRTCSFGLTCVGRMGLATSAVRPRSCSTVSRGHGWIGVSLLCHHVACTVLERSLTHGPCVRNSRAVRSVHSVVGVVVTMGCCLVVCTVIATAEQASSEEVVQQVARGAFLFCANQFLPAWRASQVRGGFCLLFALQ